MCHWASKTREWKVTGAIKQARRRESIASGKTKAQRRIAYERGRIKTLNDIAMAGVSEKFNELLLDK
jgi:hypothetical protein